MADVLLAEVTSSMMTRLLAAACVDDDDDGDDGGTRKQVGGGEVGEVWWFTRSRSFPRSANRSLGRLPTSCLK